MTWTCLQCGQHNEHLFDDKCIWCKNIRPFTKQEKIGVSGEGG